MPFTTGCRNPGRLEEFKTLTGNDEKTIKFLEKEKEVKNYLASVFKLVDQSIENYKSRNFTDLMIAFGCTGGQHRSVYCSSQLRDYIKDKHKIDVELRHRELEMK